MQGIKQSSTVLQTLPFLLVLQHFAASYFAVQFEMRRFIATICLMTGIYFDDAPEKAAHPLTHQPTIPTSASSRRLYPRRQRGKRVS